MELAKGDLPPCLWYASSSMITLDSNNRLLSSSEWTNIYAASTDCKKIIPNSATNNQYLKFKTGFCWTDFVVGWKSYLNNLKLHMASSFITPITLIIEFIHLDSQFWIGSRSRSRCCSEHGSKKRIFEWFQKLAPILRVELSSFVCELESHASCRFNKFIIQIYNLPKKWVIAWTAAAHQRIPSQRLANQCEYWHQACIPIDKKT